jgi:C-terminal processing protease CtpA/Prc
MLVAKVILCLDLAVCPSQEIGQKSKSTLDRDLIQQTVETVGRTIHKEYFDARLAATVERALQERAAAGRYAQQRTPESLASKLTGDLLELTHDKHLAVTVVRSNSPAVAEDKRSDDSREATARRSNGGVQRAEVLAGNVGYLNLTSFFRPDEAREAILAAMRLLRHTDALILDVRDHGGGSPDTAALLASYFFDERRMPLFEIVPRSGEKRVYETESAELAERNAKRPMYVLTSRRTFSAGEGIAFMLQERRRVEVIGETTAGAANPGRPYRVNIHFEVTVPNGKVLSAIRGSNWEGAGVTPDVKVAADEALRVGHRRALERLLSTTEKGSWRDVIERHLKTLKAVP